MTFSVTFRKVSSVNRKSYRTENNALRSIGKWLESNRDGGPISATLYSQGGAPRVFKSDQELAVTQPAITDFYASAKWLSLRYQALEKFGNRCACCGAQASDQISMHVDHIKPRSRYPELALEISNLQILCDACNLGKSNKFETRWSDN